MKDTVLQLERLESCAPEWRVLLEQATREVFEVMLGIELGPEGGPPPPDDKTVTAFVGIGGDMRGVVSLITSVEAAQKMAAAMLGVPPEEADGSAWDAFGEICNMVGGAFKGKLAEKYPHCVLSLPTVVTGADYKIRVLSNGITAEMRLSFEGHLFRALLEVQQQSAAG
jgi:chemotaxis protein CheX